MDIVTTPSATLTDCTVNDHCSDCGNCCSNFLPIAEHELRRIHKFVQKHQLKEQRHNVINGIDATCPFRDEVRRKCLIYSVRPDVCASFMCNQNKDEIDRTKVAYHLSRPVISMRKEFFGNNEDADLLASTYMLVDLVGTKWLDLLMHL